MRRENLHGRYFLCLGCRKCPSPQWTDSSAPFSYFTTQAWWSPSTVPPHPIIFLVTLALFTQCCFEENIFWHHILQFDRLIQKFITPITCFLIYLFFFFSFCHYACLAWCAWLHLNDHQYNLWTYFIFYQI